MPLSEFKDERKKVAETNPIATIRNIIILKKNILFFFISKPLNNYNI